MLKKSANLNAQKKCKSLGGWGWNYQTISQKSANLNRFKKLQIFIVSNYITKKCKS